MLVKRGKRLRASLLFASMSDCEAAGLRDALSGAAAVELVHAASLIHDDIVDGCAVRRGLPALHMAIGERGATLTGSYLVQHALTLIAGLRLPVRRRIGEVARRLSAGQLLEMLRAFETGMLLNERLSIMTDKTAAAFGLACELGGVLSGRSDESSLHLREFGAALGMVFQIADDVDDLFASSLDLGRSPGSDLGSGVITLPLVFALRTDARSEIVRLLDAAATIDVPDRVARCRSLIRATGSLARTYELALDFVERAEEHSAHLPPSEGIRWMSDALGATIARIARHAEGADADHL
jgi:heptaprenyl diphosphate synthase